MTTIIEQRKIESQAKLEVLQIIANMNELKFTTKWGTVNTTACKNLFYLAYKLKEKSAAILNDIGYLIEGEAINNSEALIISLVNKHFNVDCKRKTRKREIANARFAACYFLRKYTSLSLKTIGEDIFGLDHTSVIHAIHKCSIYMQNEPDYKSTIYSIQAELESLTEAA